MPKRKRIKSLFPRRTLMDAVRVPQAIQDNNAGQPYAILDLSIVLKQSPTSSWFRSLITASGQFGLTKGSFAAKSVSLTDRGRSIVAPKNVEEKNNALLEALLSINVFKTFYERYDGQKFPKLEFIQNTFSKDFGVPSGDVATCYDFIIKNATEFGILTDISGSTYLRLDNLSTEVSQKEITQEEISEEETETHPIIPVEDKPAEAVPSIPTIPSRSNKIFVIHGKNKKPLEQLKKILDGFKVPYSVAIEEPHGGRPISQKVAELMNECTSAIVLFTADEKYVDKENNEYYRPSDNTVYELGAAGVLYGSKIMILKEDGVSLASDFNDLGYISFEKNNLTVKAMELFQELVNFDLVEIKAK